MSSSTTDQGFELEKLSRLKFYDHHFTYDEKSFSYADVCSLEYTAVQTKHSINFVPTGTTYEATLRLFIDSGDIVHVKQEQQLFGKQKEFYLAVARAASLLSQVTFRKRISTSYLRMKDKGFLNWGDFQIRRDGDLFYRNEKVCGLGSGEYLLLLTPFAVRVSKKDKSFRDRLRVAWSGDLTLPIHRDRDCFLYLMKHEFGISWANEDVPDKIPGISSEQQKPANKDRDRYLILLGLSRDATEIEIKSAYRAHVRRLHPDVLRAAGASASEIKLAEDSLKLMNHAYEELLTERRFS